MLLTVGAFFFVGCETIRELAPVTDRGDVHASEASERLVATVDTVGNVVGSLGVPYVSFAGEAAAGLLGLITLFYRARYSREKSTLTDVIKGVEKGVHNSEVKTKIRNQVYASKNDLYLARRVDETI